MLLFPNLERKFLYLVKVMLRELNVLILIKNNAVLKPFLDYLAVQTANNLITMLFLFF